MAEPAQLVSAEARALPTAAAVATSFGPLEGKVFLVTGASSGIGKECARALAGAGATVFAACRPGEKSRHAADELKAAASPTASIHLLDCDLGSPESVRSCAETFLSRSLPLHALINSAGINGVPRWGQLTPGVETQFAVNFLGHCLLARLLHDRLASTEGARLVVVSSESHRRVSERGFELGSQLPPPEASYDPLHAYAFSNLCRIFWAKELAQKVPYPVLCLHPGVVSGTGMLQHMGPLLILRQLFLAFAWELGPSNPLQSLEQGSRAQTWCAVAPLEDVAPLSGKYLSGNPERRGSKAWSGVVEPSPLAVQRDLAAEVFAFVERYFDGGGNTAESKGAD